MNELEKCHLNPRDGGRFKNFGGTIVIELPTCVSIGENQWLLGRLYITKANFWHFFWPAHPLCQHKFSKERQQIWLFSEPSKSFYWRNRDGPYVNKKRWLIGPKNAYFWSTFRVEINRPSFHRPWTQSTLLAGQPKEQKIRGGKSSTDIL